MNETEWLACEDPVLMMSFLGTSFRGRKRLLVGMAICCRIRHLLDTDDARQTFVILERCADNLASDVEEDQLILLSQRERYRPRGLGVKFRVGPHLRLERGGAPPGGGTDRTGAAPSCRVAVDAERLPPLRGSVVGHGIELTVTSNTNREFGVPTLVPPPYARYDEMSIRRVPPTRMPISPAAKPGIKLSSLAVK